MILHFSFITGEGASPQVFHTVSPGPPSAHLPCRVPPTTPLNGGPGSLPREPPSVPQAFPPLAGPGGLFPLPRLPDPVPSGGSSGPCFLPRGNAPSPAPPPPPAVSLNAPSYNWGAALRSSLVSPSLGSPPAPCAPSPFTNWLFHTFPHSSKLHSLLPIFVFGSCICFLIPYGNGSHQQRTSKTSLDSIFFLHVTSTPLTSFLL